MARSIWQSVEAEVDATRASAEVDATRASAP
jgi:hypothetical protein